MIRGGTVQSASPGVHRGRRTVLAAVLTDLIIWAWVEVPAAKFLLASAFFLAIALLGDVVVLLSSVARAVLPELSAVTVLLGVLTAYGAWAYNAEKPRTDPGPQGPASSVNVPRRIK